MAPLAIGVYRDNSPSFVYAVLGAALEGDVVVMIEQRSLPDRFELLRRIAESGEICCRDLVSAFPVSQATVSHHLKILADAGLVTVRREGQFGYYRVRPGMLRAYARTLAGDLAGKPRGRRSP